MSDSVTIPEKEWKKHRVRNKIYFTIAIVSVFLLIVCFYQGWSLEKVVGLEQQRKNLFTNNQSNMDDCNLITTNMMGVVKGIVEGIDSFWITMLVVLGIVYLIQISISISFDIIEIILILYMFSSKIFEFIFKRNKKGERE